MYTFNFFVYGHRMANNPELNNSLREWDLEFQKGDYEVSFPYNGGQVRGDIYSVIFGKIITDDDNNPNYVREVRNAKESDYEKDYQKFVNSYKQFLKDVEFEGDDKILVEKLINFLDNTKPEFYSVEASS